MRDDGWVDYEVSIVDSESRPTAVVAARTTWKDFPSLWGQLLGEVWDCLHAGGINGGCRNIMLYLDGCSPAHDHPKFPVSPHIGHPGGPRHNHWVSLAALFAGNDTQSFCWVDMSES